MVDDTGAVQLPRRGHDQGVPGQGKRPTEVVHPGGVRRRQKVRLHPASVGSGPVRIDRPGPIPVHGLAHQELFPLESQGTTEVGLLSGHGPSGREREEGGED